MRILTRGLESLAEAVATGGDVSLSSVVVHGGNYALRANAPGSDVAWARFGRADGSPFDLAALYVRVWFRFDITPPATGEEFLVVESSGGYKLFLRLYNVRRIGAFAKSGTSGLALGATVLSLDTWYLLECMVGKESAEGANDGAWAVRINGAAEMSGTGDVGAVNAAFVRLGGAFNRSTASVNWYFDDLAVDDSGWPGAGNPAALAGHYRRQRCS